jgi:hypothetical protein
MVEWNAFKIRFNVNLYFSEIKSDFETQLEDFELFGIPNQNRDLVL